VKEEQASKETSLQKERKCALKQRLCRRQVTKETLAQQGCLLGTRRTGMPLHRDSKNSRRPLQDAVAHEFKIWSTLGRWKPATRSAHVRSPSAGVSHAARTD
jgi:hypothetical protein